MKTIKHSLFAKQPSYNPTLQWRLLVMFLFINIELVSEQPIGKCLTLSYCKKKCHSVCKRIKNSKKITAKSLLISDNT